MATTDTLLAPIEGAEHLEIRGVQIDLMHAGAARVKRVVYPPGFRWSSHLKDIIGTELCLHAHVGFLARGSIQIKFADGYAEVFTAPHVLAIEPGHDGWVEGDEPAVIIEFDFEKDTIQLMAIPTVHSHKVA